MSGNDEAGQPGRRRFLAGIAAVSGAAVAGCSDLPLIGDDAGTSVQFTASEVERVLADGEPTIEWPVPVTPDSSALADGLERVDALLADVPDSIGPADVPNGVVREAIVDGREEAITARDEAAEATGETAYHALRDSRKSREAARNAVTTWLAIDADDAIVDELRDERDAVRSAVDDRRESIEYRGENTDGGRLRAALYGYQREADLGRVDGTLDRWNVHETDDVVELGESAGELEFATATADVWEHLDEQHAAASGDDLEAAFEEALERSIEAAEAVAFPEQNGDDWYEAIGVGDLDDQYLEFVLWRAGRPVGDARDGMEAALRNGRLGTGLYHALEFEVAHRAFETVRDRIADGAVDEPSLEDVRTERTEALAAAAKIRESEAGGEPITAPSLGAFVFAETLQSLEWVDDGVRRAAENEPDTSVSLSSQYRDYVRFRAALEALPVAVDAFRERLLER